MHTYVLCICCLYIYTNLWNVHTCLYVFYDFAYWPTFYSQISVSKIFSAIFDQYGNSEYEEFEKLLDEPLIFWRFRSILGSEIRKNRGREKKKGPGLRSQIGSSQASPDVITSASGLLRHTCDLHPVYYSMCKKEESDEYLIWDNLLASDFTKIRIGFQFNINQYAIQYHPLTLFLW